jgi:hypothetical protein
LCVLEEIGRRLHMEGLPCPSCTAQGKLS